VAVPFPENVLQTELNVEVNAINVVVTVADFGAIETAAVAYVVV
jgi:hypothetical protein